MEKMTESNPGADEKQPTFKTELVKALMEEKAEGIKVKDKMTLDLIGEYLKAFVEEAVHRSILVAKEEKKDKENGILQGGESDDDDDEEGLMVDDSHVKKIVHQMLLDC